MIESKPTPEIEEAIKKAELPEGCEFPEAYQRLRVRGGLTEEDAEHWADILTAQPAACAR